MYKQILERKNKQMQLNCMKSTKEFYHLPFSESSSLQWVSFGQKTKKNTVTISDGCKGKIGYKEDAVNC